MNRFKDAAVWHPLAVGEKWTHMEQLIKTTTTMMTEKMVSKNGVDGKMVISLAKILMGEMKMLNRAFTDAQIASLLRAEDVELFQSMMDETMDKYKEIMHTLTIAAKAIKQEKQVAAANERNAAASATDAGDGEWTEQNLGSKRIKVLRKILKDQFGTTCNTCTEKQQYVTKILALKAAGAQTKDEL